MRYLLFLLSLVMTFAVKAQKIKTIYANENQVVALFFPNTIRQAVVGSESFTFSHNKDNPQHVGLLQGLSGKKSNLLVVTSNGSIYSYALAYRKALDTVNYFVNTDESIGMEKPLRPFPFVNIGTKTIEKKVLSKITIDTLKNREEYFSRFSSYHMKRNQNSLKRKRKNGLVLRLKDFIYDRTEVYALIEIKNKSGIDFELDYLKLFKVNGNKRRKSSFQKKEIRPIYKHNLPEIIRVGGSQSFILTVPKFTLGDKEKLLLELKEYHGNRLLQLVHD
ncbi:DUF4138 domain-containing protein [Zobellia laminariae]|uniref:DUF4138 domain-containing protein n=1 Tax=Zobellia laminariae TaxID=248906 RepID=UPI003EF844EC